MKNFLKKIAKKPELHSHENGPRRAIARNPFFSITQKADPLLQGDDNSVRRHLESPAPYLPVEKSKIRRPFKNGEMQGSEKIQ
ncbi:MAG: hypothetical protein Q8R89_06430, partial [Desulfomicrobium sp.]|nr:hypothetical protein [Desulfomicrobium sp.]